MKYLIIFALIGMVSCATIRRTAPTYDDLAGVPMVYGLPIRVECDHFFIREAYTINDIRTGADYHPCICIHCKTIEVCK
jgi:hypothetical protein